MVAGERVGEEEGFGGFGGVGGGFARGFGFEFYRTALFEEDGDVFAGVGCLLDGVEGEFPHVLWRSHVGVFEAAGFVAAVGEVLVYGPGLRFCRGDGDLHLLGVVEQVVAAGEAVVEFGDSPGGDDFDLGMEGVEC